MIKYTGYGNAAGMFAKRGLLGGRNGQTSNYSSDSDDSETEEYFKHKEGINPVMGCYQAPRPNPTAHMTEEQVNSYNSHIFRVRHSFDFKTCTWIVS